MTSDAFLRRLRRGLHGFPNDEIEEIVGDYASHFSESVADSRSEAEVAEALGDPDRIAREIRADRGLRRFEQHWSLTNLFAALMALCGLAIVDLFLRQGSGLGVLAACRNRTAGQKMVVLSNYATPDVRMRCAQLGVDAVFDKSNEIDALVDYCIQHSTNGAASRVHG